MTETTQIIPAVLLGGQQSNSREEPSELSEDDLQESGIPTPLYAPREIFKPLFINMENSQKAPPIVVEFRGGRVLPETGWVTRGVKGLQKLGSTFAAAAKNAGMKAAFKLAAAGVAGAAGANVYGVALAGGLGVTIGEAIMDYRKQQRPKQNKAQSEQGFKGFFKGALQTVKGFFGFVKDHRGEYLKKLAMNSGLGLLGAGVGAGIRENWGEIKDFLGGTGYVVSDYWSSLKNLVGFGEAVDPVATMPAVQLDVAPPVEQVTLPESTPVESTSVETSTDIPQSPVESASKPEVIASESAVPETLIDVSAEAPAFNLNTIVAEPEEVGSEPTPEEITEIDPDYTPLLDSVYALNHLEEIAAEAGNADMNYWIGEAWGGNAIAFKHLAHYLAQYGDYVGAQALIDKSLSLDPDLLEAQKFQRDLLTIPGAKAAIEAMRGSAPQPSVPGIG